MSNRVNMIEFALTCAIIGCILFAIYGAGKVHQAIDGCPKGDAERAACELAILAGD